MPPAGAGGVGPPHPPTPASAPSAPPECQRCSLGGGEQGRSSGVQPLGAGDCGTMRCARKCKIVCCWG
eukprot:9300802-Alexandrium_andersonii.AAC.1